MLPDLVFALRPMRQVEQDLALFNFKALARSQRDDRAMDLHLEVGIPIRVVHLGNAAMAVGLIPIHRNLFPVADEAHPGYIEDREHPSFWLVEALTRAGRSDRTRLEEARLMFEQMLGYANHLGLYAEETGPSGEALGNFPQAFTHLALISAAFNLDKALGTRG